MTSSLLQYNGLLLGIHVILIAHAMPVSVGVHASESLLNLLLSSFEEEVDLLRNDGTCIIRVEESSGAGEATHRLSLGFQLLDGVAGGLPDSVGVVTGPVGDLAERDAAGEGDLLIDPSSQLGDLDQ